MEIRHYVPGGMMPQVISHFLSESRNWFPAEVGEFDLTAWPSKLAANADSFCVCRNDGSLSAALFAYLNTETHVGYVPFICVLPECEKGTGHCLHEFYRHVALQHGMTTLHLEVLKTNAHAISFYQRQGYTIVEDRDDRGRWLMELSLAVDGCDKRRGRVVKT